MIAITIIIVIKSEYFHYKPVKLEMEKITEVRAILFMKL